jgi:hypothetical protein
MLNNFDGFILEKQVISLILENDLKSSPEFLMRLKKIKDKSKVANILFTLFDEEYYIAKDLPQNWIDVTSEPEMVSFLSDQRAKRSPMQWDEDDSKFYGVSGRGQIKIGRFAQALLGDPEIIDDLEFARLDHNMKELTPRDYEEFVNLYKSEFIVVSNEFKMVKGDEISYYYDIYNHAYGGKGQLGSSCMRYTKCQEYFSIYQKNPEVCQLLVYVNQDNKVLGRALVWKLEKKVDGCPAEYFMDRVYCGNDSDMIKFKNYAKEKGWVMKDINNSGVIESLFFNYNGTVILSHINVQLKDFRFENYPFVDTVSFLHLGNGKLHNIKGKNTIELTDTGGEFYDSLDGESRKDVLKELLEEAINDSDYSAYRDLIEKALDKLSS